MLSALSLGLLILGPFVAIAFAAREGDFRAARLAVAAVLGHLLGILIFAAINVAIRVLANNRLVVFFPPSSRIDPLITFVVPFAFIVAYPLAVAGMVWLAHFAYLRIQRAH
jgi:hypothetical protein